MFCLPIEEAQYLRNGATLPMKFSKKTALVLCIKLDSGFVLDINVKLFGVSYGRINWTPSSLTVSEPLNKTNEFVRTDHNDFHRCSECLVISSDGRGHLRPCPPTNTISMLRSNVYSRPISRLFEIRFEDPRYRILLLNNETGDFVDVNPNMVMNNEILEGFFSFKTVRSGKCVMSFDAVSVKRFAILFAFCRNESWRIRLCLVFTTKNGVLGYKVTKTLYAENNGSYEVPATWKRNTVLFFGIQSGNKDVDMIIRIHTQNMYEARISYDCSRDEVHLSDEILTSNARNRPFANRLYSAPRRPVASISAQRHVQDQSVLAIEPNEQNEPSNEATNEPSKEPSKEPPKEPNFEPNEQNEDDSYHEAFNSFQFWAAPVPDLPHEDNNDLEEFNDFRYWQTQVIALFIKKNIYIYNTIIIQLLFFLFQSYHSSYDADVEKSSEPDDKAESEYSENQPWLLPESMASC